MKYRELKEGIERKLRSAAEDFFTIGYYLRQISEGALFLEDGYKSIWEFAEKEYGLSISAASRYIGINSRFSQDDGRTMEPKYIGMGVSKLQEMLTLSDEDLEQVTKETTVREIRAIKAAKKQPLSFFGWPAKVYPEGSLIATKGCAPADGSKGGQDCFSCSRDCAIRQEERWCYTATCGSPFPCSFTKEKNEQVARFSANKDRCLHLHPELAPTRDGDGEPQPCCLLCDAYKENACSLVCCDVAKKEREKQRKEHEREQARQAAERKTKEREEEKAKEEARPHISEREWRILYTWLRADRLEEITAAELKKENKSHCGTLAYSEGRSGWAECSPRGIRLSRNGKKTKEETWTTAAKALREIQKEKQNKIAQEDGPEIIDAEFTEIDEAPAALDPKPATGSRAAFEKARAKYNPQPEPKAEIVDPEPEQPWKNYEVSDVSNILHNFRFDLEQYEQCQAEATNEKEMLPEWTLKKQQILVDALQLLFDKMSEEDPEDEDDEEE